MPKKHVLSEKHAAVITPRDDMITAMLNDAARHVEVKGNVVTVCKHRPQQARVLNNIGYNVPSPIHYRYGWGNITPFESQVKTASMLTLNRRAYVLSEMGVGKTLAALFAADYLMQEGEIKSALIVAPLSTLACVWERDIFRHFVGRRAVVLHGTKAKRLRLLREEADFYIINPDGVNVIRKELIAKKEIDCVIIDELTMYKNNRTRRWKSLRDVIIGRSFVWGMTGSPTPNDPTDAYGQIKLVTPERVKNMTFTRFKDLTMRQVTQFKWVPRRSAMEFVNKLMRPSIRFTRDECLDLPPITYSTREVKLSAEQKAAYKDMVSKYKAEFEDGTITAANAAVKANKLLQICLGAVYDDNGDVIKMSIANRIAVLEELLDETDNKIIVFIPYVGAVDIVESYFKAKGIQCAAVTGSVSKADRDYIFNTFQHTNKLRLLVAHPKTMAHGLNLTAANIVVWLSPVYSLEIYSQANARITRTGQKRAQHVINITASPIETAVYRALESKDKMQNVLLDLIEAGG